MNITQRFGEIIDAPPFNSFSLENLQEISKDMRLSVKRQLNFKLHS